MLRVNLLLLPSIFMFFLAGYLIFSGENINIPMFMLSLLLFMCVTLVIVVQHNHFKPIVFFSVLFYGYAFSGVYFSFDNNIDNAIYYTMTSFGFDISSMTFSLFLVSIGYLASILGFIIGDKLKFKFKYSMPVLFNQYNSNNFRIFLMVLILSGGGYWLYISFKVANGPIDLLSKVGIFHALLKDGISTLPYLLSLGGVYLLFLRDLAVKSKPTKVTTFLIILVFFMLISKGRLSGSVFYLFTFPIIFIIFKQSKLKVKSIYVVILLFLFLLILYLLRFYSNVSYVDYQIVDSPFVLFGKLFFGRTNIGDLQSISFAVEYIDNHGLLYGQSFLDFTRFWFDRLTPLSLENISVGIRIKNEFFSDISGAPAPGIISEMIINFGLIGSIFSMFILGWVLSVVGNLIIYKRDLLSIFIYSRFLIFTLILPKVDSTSIQGFIWSLIPVLVIVFAYKLLCILPFKYIRN